MVFYVVGHAGTVFEKMLLQTSGYKLFSPWRWTEHNP